MFNETLAVARKFGAKVSDSYLHVGIVTGVALAPVLSFAQTTDPFDDAVSDVKIKVAKYAAALVGVAAVGVAFMVAVKYVKKIRGAA